jgi:hypothetical protein
VKAINLGVSPLFVGYFIGGVAMENWEYGV